MMNRKWLAGLIAGTLTSLWLNAAEPAKPSAKVAAPDFSLSAETFFKPDTNYRNNRKVFAWYMVCCGPFNGGWDASLEQYKLQIKMAQSMGIDGFGLDVMQANAQYRSAVEKMFQAAREMNNGFTLFFEFDYARPDLKERTAEIVELLKKYTPEKCYEKIDGRPLVCYYGVDMSVENNPVKGLKWWKNTVVPELRSAKLDIHFVPTTFQQSQQGGGDMETSKLEIAGWGDAIGGMSMWQIQNSPIGGGLNILERQAQALHQAGKTWMSTVALHYWCGSYFSVPTPWYWEPGKPTRPDRPNGSYYEHAGGKGLDQQWQSVINVQKPEWVMMLTWNDYNESYMEPVDDYKKYPNGTTNAPLGWYKSIVGLDELNRYYIQWYKTGVQPQIIADSLFYSYRTSSQKLVASEDPRPPVKIGNGPIGDDLYITTALTSPARLRVVSGDQTREFDVPVGIAQTVTPFSAGKQSFSLWRDGKMIASVDGEPVESSIKFYNYRPTTGYVRAVAK